MKNEIRISKKPHVELDGTDRKILELLQEKGRLSNVDLAKRLGLAPPSALNRVRNLEAAGVIRSYHARVNPDSLNRKLLAFVFVKTDSLKKENRAGGLISRLPGVMEVHHIAGEDAILVKVRIEGPEALAALIREELSGIDGIISTKTTIVLHTVKESFTLPAVPTPKHPARMKSGRGKRNAS